MAMVSPSFQPAPLVALHLATTFMMTGVILIIQWVHYPLFTYVARDAFASFHREHGRRITWIVGPLMGLELASGCSLAFLRPCGIWVACAGLSVMCFVLTGMVSVPLHNILADGWDAPAQDKLVRTNFWRTSAWIAHALLLLFWLVY